MSSPDNCSKAAYAYVNRLMYVSTKKRREGGGIKGRGENAISRMMGARTPAPPSRVCPVVKARWSVCVCMRVCIYRQEFPQNNILTCRWQRS